MRTLAKFVFLLTLAFSFPACWAQNRAPKPPEIAIAAQAAQAAAVPLRTDESGIAALKLSLEGQDKRLSDIWGVVSILGYLSALLGCLITGIVVFFSLKSTSSAVAEAKAEARGIIDQWMKTNAMSVLVEETNKVLAPQLERALQEIKDSSTPILLALDAELQKTTKITESFEIKTTQGIHIKSDEALAVASLPNVTLDSQILGPVSSEVGEIRKYETPAHRLDDALHEGRTLAMDERHAEAIAKFESVIEELSKSELIPDKAMIIRASLGMADEFSGLGQLERASDLLAGLIAKYGDIAGDEINSEIQKVYLALAACEYADGSYGSALGTVEKLMQLNRLHPAVHYMVLIRAFNLKAKCLIDLQQYSEAMQVDHLLIARISEIGNASPGPSPVLNMYRRYAVIRTATALTHLQRTVEAKHLLRSYIERPSKSGRPQSVQTTIHFRLALASICEREQKYDEALATYMAILELTTEKGRMLPRYIMEALLGKAAILSKLGLAKEEIGVYDEIIGRWNDDPGNPKKRQQNEYVVTAKVNKAIALAKIKKPDEALMTVISAIEAYRGATDRLIVDQVAKAVKLKALLER